MHVFRILTLSCFALLAGGALASGGHGHHGPHGQEEAPRGPHGGRWLEDGDIGLELAIVEQGVPPQFRAWIYRDQELVLETDATLRVELDRLGERVDIFEFSPREDHWEAEGIVEEPHSFDVTATLVLEGETLRWNWKSHEGRTRIEPAMAKQAGIETAVAGPGSIHRTLTSYGRLVTAPGGVSHIRARFPGEVVRVAVDPGDQVQAGDLLAEIESNESLRRYSVTAPISGVVTTRDANLGEITGENILFTVSALDPLWVELQIFPEQRLQVAADQPVELMVEGARQRTVLKALVPDGSSPFVTARAQVGNSDGRWTPGLLVEGRITVETIDVPLVVENRALQSFRDWTVVFARVGDVYEIRPLELGRTDGRYTEVVAGLEPGDRYVVENSYLIKADIEKSGASHHH